MNRCGSAQCTCTHDAPCDRGWIELPPLRRNGQSYDRVAPCPQCRPNAAQRLADDTMRGSVDAD